MYEIISYAITAVASIIVGFHMVRWMDRMFRKEVQEEPTTHDLDQPLTRARLTTLLAKARVTGSAEIRDGVVYPMHEGRAHPLATVFGNAATFASRFQNPAASSLYIRDSVNDKFVLLADLDLDHIREAAQIMRQVADNQGEKR
jgi:hypothetical protein